MPYQKKERKETKDPKKGKTHNGYIKRGTPMSVDPSSRNQLNSRTSRKLPRKMRNIRKSIFFFFVFVILMASFFINKKQKQLNWLVKELLNRSAQQREMSHIIAP
jgi:hypothetical protein